MYSVPKEKKINAGSVCILSLKNTSYIYVTANLRNQLFPRISSPLRETGESLKQISSKLGLVT